MTFRAIFFDLDDTLCDETTSWRLCAGQTAALAASHIPGLDAEAFTAAYLEIGDAFWRAMDPTRETRSILAIRTIQWLATLETFGHADPLLAETLAHDYGQRRATQLNLFPDALPLLTALRKAGRTLILITNGIQVTHLNRIAFLGLEGYFDHTLISDIVGYAKPDPRIFHHALKLANCAPREAAMIGDNPFNDVAGAQAVGMTAFWYNPHSHPLPYGVSAPKGGEIRTLSSLHDLLLPDEHN